MKTGKKKRGPKFPQGVGKREILLLALDYPDGISEGKLVDEITRKLGYSEKSGRVIKSHLDDLGPGRTVAKKWSPGEQYLIKIPSKHEPNNIKEKLIKILESQGVKVDINDLHEESFWKPIDPDFKILRYFLQNRDFSFLKTKWGPRAVDKFLFPLFGIISGVIEGYVENDKLIVMTQLEREEPEDIEKQKRKRVEQRKKFLEEREDLERKVKALKNMDLEQKNAAGNRLWPEIKRFLPVGSTHRPEDEKKLQKQLVEDTDAFLKKLMAIKHKEGTYIEGVILPDIEPDILDFLKNGFALSLTALLHTLQGLPEVKIAAALMLAAKPNYVEGGMNKRAIAIATLGSCLLIDRMKYPEQEDKIRAFFSDPKNAAILKTWLDWDFLHQRVDDWIITMSNIG